MCTDPEALTYKESSEFWQREYDRLLRELSNCYSREQIHSRRIAHLTSAMRTWRFLATFISLCTLCYAASNYLFSLPK